MFLRRAKLVEKSSFIKRSKKNLSENDLQFQVANLPIELKAIFFLIRSATDFKLGS
jgi:hypothetical protein